MQFLELMVSEEGLKVWLGAPKAEGDTSQVSFHSMTARGHITGEFSFHDCQHRELLLLHAWGSQRKKRQNKRKKTTKKKTQKGSKKKSALNSIPTFRSPPFSFLPHTQDHTLALHLQAHVCLPTNQRLQSHCTAGYLSKKNVLKETPGAQGWSPTPAMEHDHTGSSQAVHRRDFFFLGKWPRDVIGSSCWEASHCCSN